MACKRAPQARLPRSLVLTADSAAGCPPFLFSPVDEDPPRIGVHEVSGTPAMGLAPGVEEIS
jgi:hypothetical protein